jgi:hypothetical protein
MGQATESRHPAVGSLHDPTARQEHKSTLRLGQTDNLQVDAVAGRIGLRFVASVTLIDECQLDRLPGHLLHRLGKNGDLVTLLLVSGGDMLGQEVAQHIHLHVNLRALASLGSVVAGPLAALGSD